MSNETAVVFRLGATFPSETVLDAFGKRASVSGDVCPLLEPPIRTPKTLKRGPYHPAAVVDVLDRRELLDDDGDPEWMALQRKMRAAALPRSVRVVERGAT